MHRQRVPKRSNDAGAYGLALAPAVTVGSVLQRR